MIVFLEFEKSLDVPKGSYETLLYILGLRDYKELESLKNIWLENKVCS